MARAQQLPSGRRGVGGPSLALTLVAVLLLGACTGSTEAGGPAPAAVVADVPPTEELSIKAQESARGFELFHEVERHERVSVIHVSTDHWGGASAGFAFGRACLAELGAARGFDHDLVLDDCALRLGVDPDAGNDWRLVIGFLDDPSADLAGLFPDHDLSRCDGRIWPASIDAQAPGRLSGSDLWEVFTCPHFNVRGREASGPDEGSRPRLCGDG